MPYGMSGWLFPLEFDRILFYASLGGKVEEIRRAIVQ
jgi:hypothetical protein